MSISDSLTALQTAKSDIATAITAKGGTVNAGDGFSDFATDIGTITGGGTTPDITPINSSGRPYGAVQLSSNITSIGSTVSGNYGYSTFNNNSLITSINAPSVTTIERYALQNDTNLATITIPNLQYIQPYAFDRAGANVADGFTFDFSGVASIGGSAFTYSGLAGNVVIPSSVTSWTTGTPSEGITAHFQYCTRVTSIAFNQSETTIPNLICTGCTGLTSVTLGQATNNIGQSSFRNCTSLSTVSILGNISTSAFSQYTNTNNPFYGCTAIENVTVSGWDANAVFSDDTSNFSNVYSHDSIVSIFNALTDYTGGTAHWVRFGATNLARVSAEEIAVATAKNWTVS